MGGRRRKASQCDPNERKYVWCVVRGSLIRSDCYSSISFYGGIKGGVVEESVTLHWALLNQYVLYYYLGVSQKNSLEILSQLFCRKKSILVWFPLLRIICVLHMKKLFATYEALYLHARLHYSACIYA